ncbi:MAG: tRNA (adenosine(37)-N6)-threonylcarbamoyltransferase complex dimerization subunit type 1 TsaB [Myxococcales bacterium]
MLILALDTSSPWTSCALVDPDRGVVAESLGAPPAKAGEILPRALIDLCPGGDLSRVDALAVGIGPGSFTGLRVGLAAMKTIAYARKLPLACASSLHALAVSAPAAGLVVPTLEARRGEVYACAIEDGAVVAPETVLPASALPAFVAALGRRASVVGPGARANLGSLGSLTVGDEPVAPLARAVAQIVAGELRDARYDRDSVFALAPRYLQQSAAEIALAEGRVGGLPSP